MLLTAMQRNQRSDVQSFMSFLQQPMMSMPTNASQTVAKDVQQKSLQNLLQTYTQQQQQQQLLQQLGSMGAGVSNLQSTTSAPTAWPSSMADHTHTHAAMQALEGLLRPLPSHPVPMLTEQLLSTMQGGKGQLLERPGFGLEVGGGQDDVPHSQLLQSLMAGLEGGEKTRQTAGCVVFVRVWCNVMHSFGSFSVCLIVRL